MTRSHSAFGWALRRSSVIALASLALVVPVSSAQTPVNQTAANAYPAHIHSGTCDELGDVVYPLTDVALPAGEEMGAPSAFLVEESATMLADVPFQDIIDGGHAVNVHLSTDEIRTYIACGNIGGIVNLRDTGEGNEVTLALAELNNSGYVGTAWIGDDGNGGTIVAIDLIHLDELRSAGGMAEATPAS